MDHVGVIVDDLDAAIAFFAALGLEQEGRMTLGDERVDRLVALEGVRCDFAMVKTPDGRNKLELIQFLSPPPEGDDLRAPANTRGLRHLCFAVDDIHAALESLEAHGAQLLGEVLNYEDIYWLCYVRGPAGIIVELAEKIG